MMRFASKMTWSQTIQDVTVMSAEHEPLPCSAQVEKLEHIVGLSLDSHVVRHRRECYVGRVRCHRNTLHSLLSLVSFAIFHDLDGLDSTLSHGNTK